MKFFLPFLLAVLLAVSPAVAESESDKALEPVLMDGLNAIAVCMITDATAITKLTSIAKTAQSEPSPNTHRDQVEQMRLNTETLMDALTLEANLGNAVINILVHQYHHSMAEISKNLEDLSDATRQDLQKQLTGVDTFEEFETLYAPRLEACTKAMASFVNKLPD